MNGGGRGHDFCEGPPAPHRAHSDVAFLVRRQDYQRGRRMDRFNNGVGRRGRHRRSAPITRPLLVAAAMQLKLSAGLNISLLRLYASEE